MPPTPTAARGISPTPPPGYPQRNSGNESGGKNKHSKKNKKKKKRREGDSEATSNQHVGGGVQHAVQPQRQQSRDNPPTAQPAKPTPPSKKHKRAKEVPVRFTHPELDSELRRLRRSWLSPGDPLFQSALDVSYRGMRHVPAAALPQAIHKGFREAFDGLHDAGLFMYDTVQAGGKRLSKTFVTRTLLGDPGITYKYLGLRLFAHPWDREGGDFRKGPGDGLADALNDPCLSDLFQRDAGVGGALENSPSGARNVADTLKKVGNLSEWMRLRAVALQEGASEGGGKGGGSCAFNLTLINRMESSATKRDLKPDPLFAMGKCSVSWHADSCLQDFSTIGVYHCTDPVPAEPDWGIALRVSKEAEAGGTSGGDRSDVDAAGKGKARRREGGVSAASGQPASGKGTATVPEQQEQEVLTPPLLVPLQSGDAYFLLDDFNHFHEHAVVSGSSTLRYSSTHRVAATEGNTFSHVQKRCEEVLDGGRAVAKGSDSRILDLVQVRAEQALLTELESEWLNQFWVQGRRHAVLHPWWRGPMALVLATWRELERRTALTVHRLMSLRDDEGQGLSAAAAAAAAEPSAITRAFETVLRVLEERRESRSRWASRFADPAYRSLADDCSPVVPALWPADGGEGEGSGDDDGAGASSALLPRSLAGVISRLRECYAAVYRAASGGKKAGSAKAIAAGAASNWELFRAAGSPPSASSSGQTNGAPQQQQKQTRHRGSGGGGGSRAGGKDGKKRPAGSGGTVGGRAGGGGAGGRGPKRKRSKKGRKD